MSQKEDVYLVVDSVTTALMSSYILNESNFSHKTILEINYDSSRPYDMLGLYLDILGVSSSNSLILVPNFHNTAHKSKIYRILRLLYYLAKNYRLMIKLWNKKIIGSQDSLIVQLLMKINWASNIVFFDEGIHSVLNDIETKNTKIEFKRSHNQEVVSIYRPFPGDRSIPILLYQFKTSKFALDLIKPTIDQEHLIKVILFPLNYGKNFDLINRFNWDSAIHLAIKRLNFFLSQLSKSQSKNLVVYCKFHPSDYRSKVQWENLLVSNKGVKYIFPRDYSNYRDINAVPAEILVNSLNPNFLYFMDFSSIIFSSIKNESLKIVFDSFIWNSLNELIHSPFFLKEKALLKYITTNFNNFLDYD